jgi:hypothetical protein
VGDAAEIGSNQLSKSMSGLSPQHKPKSETRLIEDAGIAQGKHAKQCQRPAPPRIAASRRETARA